MATQSTRLTINLFQAAFQRPREMKTKKKKKSWRCFCNLSAKGWGFVMQLLLMVSLPLVFSSTFSSNLFCALSLFLVFVVPSALSLYQALRNGIETQSSHVSISEASISCLLSAFQSQISEGLHGLHPPLKHQVSSSPTVQENIDFW